MIMIMLLRWAGFTELGSVIYVGSATIHPDSSVSQYANTGPWPIRQGHPYASWMNNEELADDNDLQGKYVQRHQNKTMQKKMHLDQT